MNTSSKTITVNESVCKKVREMHPWIYSGAICSTSPDCTDGDIVKVQSEKKEFLGYGFYNSKSKIIARMISFENAEINPEQWIKEAIHKAVQIRKWLMLSNGKTEKSNTARLVNSESDGIPGLIIDKYAGCLVISLLTAGIDRLRKAIVEYLIKEYSPDMIYEVSDQIREKEGLGKSTGLLYGTLNKNYHFDEHGITYVLNLEESQKTGTYLDQSQNHYRIRKYAENKKVLDVFCYNGGFTLNALKADAKEVTSIDSSSAAMEQLHHNIELNNKLWFNKWIPLTGKAVETMKTLHQEEKRYDIVILDPPKLAPHRRDVPNALRYYKELNMSAMKILNENGIGICFSCSQGVSVETLCEVVRWASVDVKRKVAILEILLQSPDHPYIATVPESLYLKGIVYQIW